jgi:stearoyl-CoA desaturase (delta-9 desaturase)
MTQTAESLPISLEPERRAAPDFAGPIPFAIVHLMPLCALWTGATTFDWILCGILYVARMFFVTAGYHRYFSHRSYKTSRLFQYFLAFMAETSAQKGVLWWAAHHRDHHKYSDTPKDPHSMKIYGFWYSHLGWILGPDYNKTNFERVHDLEKFPELVWLDRHFLVPPIFLAICCLLLGAYFNAGEISLAGIQAGGWSTLWIGFFLSTALLYHGTFSINSIMHKFGKARYHTGDESKNSFWLALLTLGEGWHNNHHYYQSASRQGFFWWEIDISYYALKVLSWFGLVWDLRQVPDHVLHDPAHLIAE